MTTATATADRWIVCDDYARGPFTAARAESRLAHANASQCELPHRIEVSATRPTTAAELRVLYAEWDAPFLADPFDTQAMDARGEQTRELAAAILAAPIGAGLGDLTIADAGWSAETAARADTVAEAGTPEWRAALGAHEDATLTGDGRGAIRDAWCDEPEGDEQVRYTAWTAAGQVAHGFVCKGCRRITQTG